PPTAAMAGAEASATVARNATETATLTKLDDAHRTALSSRFGDDPVDAAPRLIRPRVPAIPADQGAIGSHRSIVQGPDQLPAHVHHAHAELSPHGARPLDRNRERAGEWIRRRRSDTEGERSGQ